MRKNAFIDRHEHSCVMEDRNNFLIKIEDLKLCMVNFEENSAMKLKIYPSDYKVGGDDRQPIIVITHNECIFFANNGIQTA